MYPQYFFRSMPMMPQITPKQTMTPSDFIEAPGSPTSLGTEYTQGYLKTQIGKRVKIVFLIGSNMTQDRDGVIEQVGISYIILREPLTKNLILCDIYSIKFVTIYNEPNI